MTLLWYPPWSPNELFASTLTQVGAFLQEVTQECWFSTLILCTTPIPSKARPKRPRRAFIKVMRRVRNWSGWIWPRESCPRTNKFQLIQTTVTTAPVGISFIYAGNQHCRSNLKDSPGTEAAQSLRIHRCGTNFVPSWKENSLEADRRKITRVKILHTGLCRGQGIAIRINDLSLSVICFPRRRSIVLSLWNWPCTYLAH